MTKIGWITCNKCGNDSGDDAGFLIRWDSRDDRAMTSRIEVLETLIGAMVQQLQVDRRYLAGETKMDTGDPRVIKPLEALLIRARVTLGGRP